MYSGWGGGGKAGGGDSKDTVLENVRKAELLRLFQQSTFEAKAKAKQTKATYVSTCPLIAWFTG